MRTLTLLRHAKSDWNGPAGRDFDRPLNERGRDAARRMGVYMAAEGLAFDAVLASPAVRVRETLDRVMDGYGRAIAPTFDARIYMAPASVLLDLVRGTAAAVERLLLVGHNPGMEELALGLGADGPLRREVGAKYPTAALTEIVLGGAGWRDVTAGRITRFVRPRDLEASSYLR